MPERESRTPNQHPKRFLHNAISKIAQLPPENIDPRFKVATVIAVTSLSLQAGIIALYAAIE